MTARWQPRATCWIGMVPGPVPQEAKPCTSQPCRDSGSGQRAFTSRLGLSAESSEGQQRSGVSCGPGVTRSMASSCWVQFCVTHYARQADFNWLHIYLAELCLKQLMCKNLTLVLAGLVLMVPTRREVNHMGAACNPSYRTPLKKIVGGRQDLLRSLHVLHHCRANAESCRVVPRLLPDRLRSPVPAGVKPLLSVSHST